MPWNPKSLYAIGPWLMFLKPCQFFSDVIERRRLLTITASKKTWWWYIRPFKVSNSKFQHQVVSSSIRLLYPVIFDGSFWRKLRTIIYVSGLGTSWTPAAAPFPRLVQYESWGLVTKDLRTIGLRRAGYRSKKAQPYVWIMNFFGAFRNIQIFTCTYLYICFLKCTWIHTEYCIHGLIFQMISRSGILLIGPRKNEQVFRSRRVG